MNSKTEELNKPLFFFRVGEWTWYAPTEEYLQVIGYHSLADVFKSDYLFRNHEKQLDLIERDGLLCLSGEGRKFALKIANWREELHQGHLFPVPEEQVKVSPKQTPIEAAIAENERTIKHLRIDEKEGVSPPPALKAKILEIKERNKQKRISLCLSDNPKDKSTTLETPTKTQEEIDRANINFIKKHWSVSKYPEIIKDRPTAPKQKKISNFGTAIKIILRDKLSSEERQERRRIERKNDRYVRFPALFWSAYKQSTNLWCYARFLDIEGKGWSEIDINAVSQFFNRKPSTIKNWLAASIKNGLCRSRQKNGENIRFYYRSIHQAAHNAGLTDLGPVGLVDFKDPFERQNLAIIATEIIQSDIQKSSRFAANKEAASQKIDRKALAPEKIISSPPCEKTAARVLGETDRNILVTEGFIAYGASQETIAHRRNLCRRQIQRHLSQTYRTKSAPIKNWRGDLQPLIQKQIHQRLPYRCKKDFLIVAAVMGDRAKYWVDIDGRVWERKPNLAIYRHQLIRMRFRRSRIAETSNLQIL